MEYKNLKELIEFMGIDEALFLAPDCYNEAIIGISHDDRIIYSYDKLVEVLMQRGNTLEDARAWADSNIVESLVYLGEKSPIVLYEIEINGED